MNPEQNFQGKDGVRFAPWSSNQSPALPTNEQFGFAPTLPFPPSPCPGLGCPSSIPQHPVRLPGLQGTFPLHECHLVGRPSQPHPHPHPSRVCSAWGTNPLHLTPGCGPEQAASAHKCHRKNQGSYKGKAGSLPFPTAPSGFGKSSSYLGDFFRSLLKVLHSPTVKSYCAARIHFLEWHLFGRRTVEWLQVSPLKNTKSHNYSQEWHRSMFLLSSPPTALKHPIPCSTWIKPQHIFWK